MKFYNLRLFSNEKMIRNTNNTQQLLLHFVKFSENLSQFFTATSRGFKVHNLDPFEEAFHIETNTSISCVDVCVDAGRFGYVELNNRFFINIIDLDGKEFSDITTLDNIQIKEYECDYPIENFKLSKEYIFIFTSKRMIIIPFKQPNRRMNYEIKNSKFSYGSNKIAFAQTTSKICVIDLNLLEEEKELASTEFTSATENPAFSLSPDGSLVAISENSGTSFKLYDTKTQKHYRTFGRGYFKSNISCITFTEDNSLMLVTSENGTIHIFLLAKKYENQELIVTAAKNRCYRLGWLSGMLWEKWGDELAYEKIEKKIPTVVNNKNVVNICAFSKRVISDLEKKFHTRYIVVLNSIGEYKRFSFRICEDSEMKHVALCKSISTYYDKQKPKLYFSVEIEQRAKRKIKLRENKSYVQNDDEDDDISIEEIVNSDLEEPYGIVDFGAGFLKYSLSNSLDCTVIPSAVKGDQVGNKILKYDVQRICPISFAFEDTVLNPIRMKLLLEHVLTTLNNPKRVVLIFSDYLIKTSSFLGGKFTNFMKINFPNIAYQTLPQSMAVLRGLNKKTGLIINIGFTHTTASIVIDNRIVKDAFVVDKQGGDTITNNFRNILQQKYPELAKDAGNKRFVMKNLDLIKIKNAEAFDDDDEIKKVMVDLGGESYFFTRSEICCGLSEIIQSVVTMASSLIKNCKNEEVKDNVVICGGTALISGMRESIEEGLKKRGLKIDLCIAKMNSACNGVKGSF